MHCGLSLMLSDYVATAQADTFRFCFWEHMASSVHDAWLYHMTWGMLSKYQSLSVLPYFMSCASFALYKFEQDISSPGHLPGGHVDFLCTGAHETMHGDALSSGTFTDGQWMWWRRRGSRFFRLTSLHCVWKVTEPLFEYLNTDYFPLLAERKKKRFWKLPDKGNWTLGSLKELQNSHSLSFSQVFFLTNYKAGIVPGNRGLRIGSQVLSSQSS